jgi:E3 ubiquitin-protein ligase BRE1
MRTETDTCQELATIKAQLERYQAVFGDVSTLPQDSQNLEEQLRTKTDEIRRLQLLDEQHREVSRPS